MYTEIIMNILSVTGIISFAISGAVTGLEKHTDPFGAVLLSVITATGGGIMRDLLLGIAPPAALTDPSYAAIAAATGLFVFAVSVCGEEGGGFNSERTEAVNSRIDAVGLGVFAVAGAQSAIDSGFAGNIPFCVFIGTLTAVGGGFLRDITVLEIPSVMRGQIYALAALGGAALYCVMLKYGFGYAVSAFSGAGLTLSLRITAIRRGLRLPVAR